MCRRIQEKCTAEDEEAKSFWEFVDELYCNSNTDEVSRLWAQVLKILNTYIGLYFAIRSGNFMLRNSCIKDIAPIFLAYSRDKYEE